MEIVIPIRYPIIDPYVFPVFLAGPVLGGGDWQYELIVAFNSAVRKQWTDTRFKAIFPRLRFIVPCRWNESHGLSNHFVKMYTIPERKEGDLQCTQTFWEAIAISRILKQKWGLLVFGLFPESSDKPRNDGQPYGRDTYGEVGRYLTMAAYEEAEDHVLVCAHPLFPGWDVQKKNIFIFNGEALRAETSDLTDLVHTMAEVIPELLNKKNTN